MRKNAFRISDNVKTISAEEIRSIHEKLAYDMANSGDAISPAGVKNETLLHSAVGRQSTGYGADLKYPTIELNAATLCYGICCNHPFHNGNKRTALVAMLCHLDRNDRTLRPNVSQDDLYELMKKVAGHGFTDYGSHRRDQSDWEVVQLATWIRNRVRPIDRSERLVTFRELRTILQRFGFHLENPAGSRIDVMKYEEVDERTWFFKRRKEVRRRITRIPWPRDGAVVGRPALREIRLACGLTEDMHGVDSQMFYASERPIDYFLTHYRSVLRRLAKT